MTSAPCSASIHPGRRSGNEMRQLNYPYAFKRPILRLAKSALPGGTLLLDIDDGVFCCRCPLRVGEPFLRATHHAEAQVKFRGFILELLCRLLLDRLLYC